MWDRLRRWWAREPYLRPSLRSDLVARSLVPLSDDELWKYLKRRGGMKFRWPKELWIVQPRRNWFWWYNISGSFFCLSFPFVKVYFGLTPISAYPVGFRILEMFYWAALGICFIFITISRSSSLYSRKALVIAIHERIIDLTTKKLPVWKTIYAESRQITTESQFQRVALEKLINVPTEERDRSNRVKIVQRRRAINELEKQRARLTAETLELIQVEEELMEKLQAVMYQIELPTSEKVLGKAKFTASDVEARIANESGLDAKLIAETTARLNQFAERIAAREVARVEVE